MGIYEEFDNTGRSGREYVCVAGQLHKDPRNDDGWNVMVKLHIRLEFTEVPGVTQSKHKVHSISEWKCCISGWNR